MPNAGDLTLDSRFVALLVGPSGGGKTPAACSCISDEAIAAGRRVKVFDFDGRIRGLLGCPWVNRNIVDYDYYAPRTKGGVYEKLNNDLKILEVECSLGRNKYETLVLDSLTTQTFAFLCDSIPLTHTAAGTQIKIPGQAEQKAKGRSIGALMVEGPEDYKFESSGTYSMLSFFRSLPIKNIIFTAHVIDRYGKADPNDSYSQSVIVGERLSLRDKLAANIPGTFDHIIRFERKMVGNDPHFYVRFWSDLARTVYPNMPLGDQDVTGKNFYKYLQGLLALKEANNGSKGSQG